VGGWLRGTVAGLLVVIAGPGAAILPRSAGFGRVPPVPRFKDGGRIGEGESDNGDDGVGDGCLDGVTGGGREGCSPVALLPNLLPPSIARQLRDLDADFNWYQPVRLLKKHIQLTNYILDS
jgi:hypothetical protein